MSDLEKTQMLLRLARQYCKGGQVSALALEILLSVARQPQTMEQLTVSCNASHGQVNRAARQLCVWWDGKAERTVEPPAELCWLERKRMPRGKGQLGAPKHRYYLSQTGRNLLEAAGFSTPVS